MGIPDKRPVNLDLRHIRLPVPAVTSLLHRVSGILLFVALAPALYLFQSSITSAEDFASVQSALGGGGARFLLVVLAWALVHHTLAGLRTLCLDVHCGVARKQARVTAHGVNVAALVITLLAAWGLM